ncbi:MAG: aconitate hydratase AcnA [Dehalococcoidia bacterium]|nr:aconitate hydratase AcnA [Dehalococcoidia bacterium]
MTSHDQFGAQSTITTRQGPVTYFRLSRLEETGVTHLDRLPFSIRILLENMLRNYDAKLVTEQDVLGVAGWNTRELSRREVPFMPARVLLQDFTGIPAIVDMASMRSAMKRMGGDPKRINPRVPVDLVIDHSVQVDYFGTQYAFAQNVEREYERNGERYSLLKWAQKAFRNMRVVPPGTGIVHQVNLEYLASVVGTKKKAGNTVAFPDTVVGTDSHTTMVNGLGVLGWGVGGIEAEAVMVGQPYYMLLPMVVGFKLTGELPEGTTATDLVLTVTQMLRARGVVDKFVEFYGEGLSKLALPDRATISNMCPEYGATAGLFPVDQVTLDYLAATGRRPAAVELVEKYTKAQGLFRTNVTPEPEYTDKLELDMSTVVPSLAGPSRPQDRVPLTEMKRSFQVALDNVYHKPATAAPSGSHQTGHEQRGVPVSLGGQSVLLDHGVVVIAAITSCTNTSNPSVMVGAGLLAKNAVERGLDTKPWVKTSMAPGSQVVDDYLAAAGVMPYLEALGFHIVGHGCTSCIGNSGPLPEAVAQAVTEHDLVTAAVLSGNRNFEARVHPQAKANFLASPMLVVAYALAGTVDIDLAKEPLGHDPNGQGVYLRDIWPTQEQIKESVSKAVKPAMFRKRYDKVFEGDERWNSLPVPSGDLYEWDADSTYVQELPIFENLPQEPPPVRDVAGARVLAVLGDSITTDHISPAGDIAAKSPAGKYLISKGVAPRDFNTYGARRGNHNVLVRGTFANVRLRNQMVPNAEGSAAVHLPSRQEMSIYDASLRYQAEGVPLVVLAGKEYGAGSSRDWAAKGPYLQGVRAVVAQSYERIHRTNLIGMGVLPLQFMPGQTRESLGLTGFETYDIAGIAGELLPGATVDVRARREDGRPVAFKARVRIDTPIEVEYYRNGGLLQYVLRQMLKDS